MKRILFSLLLLFTAIVGAKALDASVSFCTFKGPQQNYIEIYLHLVGSRVTWVPIDSTQMKASVLVTILFKQDSQVLKFDKFNLNSPVVAAPKDFIDLHRYGLDNGVYQLEVLLQDVNAPKNKSFLRAEVEMNYEEEGLQQSDIQLLAGFDTQPVEGSPFNKNGIEMEPLPYNWYHSRMSKLYFYNEIYNSETAIGEPYYISYYIRKEAQAARPIMMRHKRIEPAPIVPVLQSLDITQLPSGNYFLVVEVRNQGRELLNNRAIFFQRANPFLDSTDSLSEASMQEQFVASLSADELRYSLKAIAPLLEDKAEEMNALIAGNNIEAQRLYLFSYWAQKHPNHPEIAYDKYMEVARAVDKMFGSGFGYGFESDRGYIYMKYGRPDDRIAVNDDPGAAPYEIWSYNHVPRTGENNRRFLFYNPSLSPGNFILLHSNVRGETNNPQWQIQLYSDAPAGDIQNDNFIDGTDVKDNFGRRAVRYFNDY